MTLQLHCNKSFKLKKENETTKDGVIRDIRNLSEHEEDYFKPIRVSNF